MEPEPAIGRQAHVFYKSIKTGEAAPTDDQYSSEYDGTPFQGRRERKAEDLGLFPISQKRRKRQRATTLGTDDRQPLADQDKPWPSGRDEHRAEFKLHTRDGEIETKKHKGGTRGAEGIRRSFGQVHGRVFEETFGPWLWRASAAVPSAVVCCPSASVSVRVCAVTPYERAKRADQVPFAERLYKPLGGSAFSPSDTAVGSAAASTVCPCAGHRHCRSLRRPLARPRPFLPSPLK